MNDLLHKIRAGHAMLLLTLTAALAVAAPARGDKFDLYARRPADDFRLPTVAQGSQGGAMMDNLPDGRLVVITSRPGPTFGLDQVELRVETAPGSRSFRYLGDIPLSASDPLWFNPGGFLTVSQGAGTVRIALGNSDVSVGVFNAADLDSAPTQLPGQQAALPSLQWFDAYSGYYTGFFVASAAWQDNSHLAVATGDFSGNSHIDLLDVTGATSTPLLDAPGGTGGVAYDAADGTGNLYYGIGYGPGVGDIGEYPAGSFPTTYASRTPVTTMLSASWLQFDADKNLLVGGGDTFGVTGHYNYFAIVDGSGLNRLPRLFDPDTNSLFNAYNVVYNDKTGEVFAWDNFGSDPQQVYAFSALATAVPEPSTLIMLATGAVALSIGAVRRRMRTRQSVTG